MAKQVNLTGGQMLKMYEEQKRRFANMRNQGMTLRTALGDIEAAIEALKELKKAGKNEKILVRVGTGIYIEAVVPETKRVKGDIGGGILEEQKVEKALKNLERRKQIAIKGVENMARDEKALAQNIVAIEKVLEETRRRVARDQGATPVVS